MQNPVQICSELLVRTFGWLPGVTVLPLRGNNAYNLKFSTLVISNLRHTYVFTLVSGNGLKAQGLRLSKCILLIFAAWLATFLPFVSFILVSVIIFFVVSGEYLEKLTYSYRGEGGFDFAIRTPCTPLRWVEFDAEMTLAWEVSCSTAHVKN